MRILILALFGLNTLSFASLPPRERLQSEMDFLRKEAFKEGLKDELQTEDQSSDLALDEQYFSDSVSTGMSAPTEGEIREKKFKARGR